MTSDPPETQASDPQVTITPEALAKIREVLEAQGDKVTGIRVTVAGRSEQGFTHGFTLVLKDAEPEGDVVQDIEGMRTFIEARNAEYLDGVVIGYQPNDPGPGGQFTFENPNPVWHDDVSMRIQHLFDEAINPQIASHGGVVNLIAVDGPRAYVEMGGGCQGCGMANVTLKQGIEVAIKDWVPEIDEVIDTTDHASGTNPYYQPSKK